MFPNFTSTAGEYSDPTHFHHGYPKILTKCGPTCRSLKFDIRISFTIIKKGSIGLEQTPPFGYKCIVFFIENFEATRVHLSQGSGIPGFTFILQVDNVIRV